MGKILRNAIGVSTGAVVARIIEIGNRRKLIGDFPGRCYVAEVALIVIVIRRLRTDVGRRRDNDFALVEIKADPAVEGERVVIVIDTGVYSTRDARHQVQPLGCVQGGERTGVVKWNAKIKDVGVRIEEVRVRVDRFRSFQGDEFAKLQVETALADNGKVKVEIPFDQVRLDDRGSRRIAEQTKRVDEARVAPVYELQFETPIELTRLGRECALEIDYELIQQRFIRPIVKEP